MTAQTPTTLKTYFQTGDRPTQAQYTDLIDSFINTVQTSAQTIVSDISVSGLVIPNGGIKGTITNNNAAAGNVGEIISSLVTISSGVPVTNNTSANITSISLTAGDWDLDSNIFVLGAAGTVTTYLAGWIGTSSATDPGPPNNGAYFIWQGSETSGFVGFSTGTTRLSLASTTTVYLGCVSLFTTSTEVAFGSIMARRVR